MATLANTLASINSSESNNRSSVSGSRFQSLKRLHRLLLRWMPGYKYFRGSATSQQRPVAEQRHSEAATDAQLDGLVVRDGETYLNAGIAKTEFCHKLDKLLQAKLKP